jgi:hypothetical protein
MSIIQTANTSAGPKIQIDGVEPLYTIAEAASALRLSYDAARRHFRNLPGVLVFYTPRRYKRPYRKVRIPRSVFEREWNNLANS